MRALLPLIGLMCSTAPLVAQGWIEPPEGRHGTFGVIKERTAVTVRVTGRVAHVAVEEWFRNRGRALGEGDYLYPLPGEAVFSDFSLFQGDQELRGEAMDAREARAIYEEIVRRKRDPALIELAGHGLLRARVFPIEPGAVRKITLRYTQVLARAGDALHFRYAAGGRTGGGGLRRPEGVAGPLPVREPAPLTFTLEADADAFRDPFSPTHRVQVTRTDGRLTVRPAEVLAGDVALFLPLARGLVGVTVATHRPPGEEGYFMLTLSPGAADGGGLPRDVAVVLDVSGSMSGTKLSQAKAALRQLLGSLHARDRFRLVAFSNTVRVHEARWHPATPDRLGPARRWVDALAAGGGTDIAGALDEAFRLTSPEGRLPIVVFVTDGLPSVGERDPERIAQAAEVSRGRVRVFAFGVGHDVNTYLLDRLSAAGRGTTAYVQPGEDVEQALGTLATKIQHPVLSDLAIAGAPVELLEVYPIILPDLFAGEELVVFGRYRSARARTGELTMTGRRGGRTERFAARVEFPASTPTNEFIPRLWAARKIGELSRTVRLEGATPERIREIRETALRYGLVSEYTSYLVQEPLDAAGRPIRLDEAAVASAPAAQAAVGRGAVAAAERARVQRETKTTADLRLQEADFLRQGHFPQARHVAGRLFQERDGVWTDLARADTVPTLDIAPYSAAYFALLRAAPELAPYLQAFEQVLVAGRGINIRVKGGGEERLAPGHVSRVVRAFRRG